MQNTLDWQKKTKKKTLLPRQLVKYAQTSVSLPFNHLETLTYVCMHIHTCVLALKLIHWTHLMVCGFMPSRVTITYNGNKTYAHYTSIRRLICPIKRLPFQLLNDNSLKSDIRFYGLSSVNLYDTRVKVAGLKCVVKLNPRCDFKTILKCHLSNILSIDFPK